MKTLYREVNICFCGGRCWGGLHVSPSAKEALQGGEGKDSKGGRG